MTKRDFQAAEYLAEAGVNQFLADLESVKDTINTQVRIVNGLGGWSDYANQGWIQSAIEHAGACSLNTGDQVEVRDANDPTRPPAIFTVKRVVTYEILNPRQGE